MKQKISVPPSLYALLLYMLIILCTILSLKHIPLLSAPIFFSIIIAYLFNPIADYFEKITKFSRGLISGVLILILVFVFTFLIINLFPYLVDQVQSAAQKLPGIIKKFSDSIRGFGEYLTKNFSDYIGDFDLMEKISEWLNDSLSGLSQFLLTAFSSLYGILLAFVYLILIPLFSFYFIKDQRKIEKTFYSLLPIKYRWRMKRKLLKIDKILSAFIRGQVIVIIILAT
ncbi:MAG: AI-2E family transporter, partial [Candidatus Aminicenantes bacterium]|nr:AI-2E family transporter [Candidatus Aminicenantes bacterium]